MNYLGSSEILLNFAESLIIRIPYEKICLAIGFIVLVAANNGKISGRIWPF
jgi:hypothetical protein